MTHFRVQIDGKWYLDSMNRNQIDENAQSQLEIKLRRENRQLLHEFICHKTHIKHEDIWY